MRTYRVKDGWLWIWESEKDGEDFIIREYKYRKLPLKDGKEVTIDDFAERLIETLQN